jgi:hypothetical protein
LGEIANQVDASRNDCAQPTGNVHDFGFARGRPPGVEETAPDGACYIRLYRESVGVFPMRAGAASPASLALGVPTDGGIADRIGGGEIRLEVDQRSVVKAIEADD